MEDQRLYKILMQWESNSDDPNDGARHLFAEVVKSDFPALQENKYLCRRSFTEMPTIEAAAIEAALIETGSQDILIKNICKDCLKVLDERFPKKPT